MDKELTNSRKLLEKKDSETLKQQLKSKLTYLDNDLSSGNRSITNSNTNNFSSNSIKKKIDYSELPMQRSDLKENNNNSTNNNSTTLKGNHAIINDVKTQQKKTSPPEILRNNSNKAIGLNTQPLLLEVNFPQTKETNTSDDKHLIIKVNNNILSLNDEERNSELNTNSHSPMQNLGRDFVQQNQNPQTNQKFNNNKTFLDSSSNMRRQLSDNKVAYVKSQSNEDDLNNYFTNTNTLNNKSMIYNNFKNSSTDLDLNFQNTHSVIHRKTTFQQNPIKYTKQTSTSINMDDLEEYYKKFSHLYTDKVNEFEFGRTINVNFQNNAIDLKNSQETLTTKLNLKQRRKTELPDKTSEKILKSLSNQLLNNMNKNIFSSTNNIPEVKNQNNQTSSNIINDHSNSNHNNNNQSFNNHSNSNNTNNNVNSNNFKLNNQDLERSYNFEDESRFLLNNNQHGIGVDFNSNNTNVINPNYNDAKNILNTSMNNNQNGEPQFNPVVNNIHSNIVDIKSQLVNYEKVYESINNKINYDSKEKLKNLKDQIEDLKVKLKEEQQSKEKLKEFHERDLQIREESHKREKSQLENHLTEELRKTISEYENKQKDFIDYYEKVSKKIFFNIFYFYN